jgi:Protein of unknown function (DUF4236)
MGASFRKRINIGGVARINLSKSGVGGSIGPTGAKLGITAKGQTYVRGGKGGIYVRESIPAQNRAGAQLNPLLRDLNRAVRKPLTTAERATAYADRMADIIVSIDAAKEQLLKDGPQNFKDPKVEELFAAVERARTELVRFNDFRDNPLSGLNLGKMLDDLNAQIEREGKYLLPAFGNSIVAVTRFATDVDDGWKTFWSLLKPSGEALFKAHRRFMGS